MLEALLFALAVVSAGPSGEVATAGREAATRRLPGFSAIVSNHIDRVMGTDKLPSGRGGLVQPGLFVTLALDQVQIFDRKAVPLQQGRLNAAEGERQCDGQCPAPLFDAFQARWLALAVESSTLDVEIPSRVLFGADAGLPVETLLQVAYAAAATRPMQPPTLFVLLNSRGRGLQALPFFLIPPRGIEVQQGAGAALALTIEIDGGTYRVHASDPDFARPREVRDLSNVRKIIGAVKKKYPGKSSVILVPAPGVSVGDLVGLITTIRQQFDRIILSAGQDVVVP